MSVPLDKGRLRKDIRKAIVQILKGATDVGNKVFPNASIHPSEDELPVIMVYPRSESVGKFNEAPRELERGLDVTIEIEAKGPEENSEVQTPEGGAKTVEDILDDMVEQVECAMSRDDTFGDVADDSILTNIEFEFDSSGGSPIGTARMTYSVTYYTMSPRSVDKQSGLAAFKTSEVDYNIGDDENTREAKDTIAIPQT